MTKITDSILRIKGVISHQARVLTHLDAPVQYEEIMTKNLVRVMKDIAERCFIITEKSYSWSDYEQAFSVLESTKYTLADTDATYSYQGDFYESIQTATPASELPKVLDRLLQEDGLSYHE